jgi:hypothetical protein
MKITFLGAGSTVFAKNDTYQYLMIGEERIAYDDIYEIRVE